MDLLLLMAERMAPSSSELVRVAFWTRAGRVHVRHVRVGGGEQVVVTVSVVLLLMLVFYDARLPMSVKSRPAGHKPKIRNNHEGCHPPCCPAMPAIASPLSALGAASASARLALAFLL